MSDNEKAMAAGIAILLVLLLLGFKWLMPGQGISGGGSAEPYQPVLQIPGVDFGDGPQLPEIYKPDIPTARRPTCGCIRGSGSIDYGYDRPSDWLVDPETYTPRKPDVKIPLLEEGPKKSYIVGGGGLAHLSGEGTRLVRIYEATPVEGQNGIELQRGKMVWMGMASLPHQLPARGLAPVPAYDWSTWRLIGGHFTGMSSMVMDTRVRAAIQRAGISSSSVKYVGYLG